MKVGDKLICKSNINFFIKGGEYTIDKISSNDINLLIKLNHNNYWFNAERNSYSYFVWDYFYTKTELRKLKLDKIKNYE